MIMTRKSKKATLAAKEVQRIKRKKPLPENKYVPAQISECEFKETTRGDTYLSAKWSHLTEGTAFDANVFNNKNSSGLDVLYDAILPENMYEFSGMDLMDKPVFVKLKFSNDDGDKKYTNIIDIKPFDEGHHTLYESFLEQRQKAEVLEEEFTEINEDGTVMRKTAMEGLRRDDYAPSVSKRKSRKFKTSNENNNAISKDKKEFAEEQDSFNYDLDDEDFLLEDDAALLLDAEDF